MHKTSALLLLAAPLLLYGPAYAADANKDDQAQSEQAKQPSKKAAAPKQAPPAMNSAPTRSFRSINPPPSAESPDGGRTDDPIGGLPGNAAPSGVDKRP